MASDIARDVQSGDSADTVDVDGPPDLDQLQDDGHTETDTREGDGPDPELVEPPDTDAETPLDEAVVAAEVVQESGPDVSADTSSFCEGAECQIEIVPPLLNSGLAAVDSSVAPLPDGGFVVAWQGVQPLGTERVVTATRFGKPGAGHGPLLKVSGDTKPDDLRTTVAALPDGRFAVAWQVSLPETIQTMAFVRIFDASQEPLAPEGAIAVGYLDPTYSVMPVIRAWPPDAFLVVVHSFPPNVLTATKLDAEGAVVWGPVTVRPDVFGVHHASVLADGRALIAWRSDDATWSQIIHGDGTLDKGAIELVAVSGSMRIAPLSGGGILTAWVEGGNQDGDSTGIFARFFGADGLPAGDRIQVNSYFFGGQTYPAAAAFPDGSSIVAWQDPSLDPSHPRGVWGQRYGVNGAKQGGETRLSPGTVSVASGPVHLATFPDGGFVVVWGAGGGIYAARYAADGTGLKP